MTIYAPKRTAHPFFAFAVDRNFSIVASTLEMRDSRPQSSSSVSHLGEAASSRDEFCPGH
jgi:hypothetical protein